MSPFVKGAAFVGQADFCSQHTVTLRASLDNAGCFYGAAAGFAYRPALNHGYGVGFMNADGCFGQSDGASGNTPRGLAWRCGACRGRLTHGLNAFSKKSAVNYHILRQHVSARHPRRRHRLRSGGFGFVNIAAAGGAGQYDSIFTNGFGTHQFLIGDGQQIREILRIPGECGQAATDA